MDQEGIKHQRAKQVFRQEVAPQLFPLSVEEHIPQGAFCRLLKIYMEKAAGKELRELYEDFGGIPYDPVALACVCMLGFVEGATTTRQMEERCIYDLRFMFVMGMLKPDHNTIGRFRHRLEPVLPHIFFKLMRSLKKDGHLSNRLVAVDGTKIKGNVSQWKQRIKAANTAEPLNDPDARLMRDRQSGIIRGYNAQIAVDADSGLIVAYDVSNRAKDDQEIPGLLESMERNLGELPDHLIADTGYDSATNHASLEASSVEGIITPHANYDAFWELDDGGELRCPAGHVPQFRGTVPKGGLPYDEFVVRQCGGCALKAACRVTNRKIISTRSGFTPHARVRNAERARSDTGQALMKERSPTVERVFAHLKHHRKLRRFTMRGLKGVRYEFGLACFVYNLEILFREACLRLLGGLGALRARWQALVCVFELLGNSFQPLITRQTNRWKRAYQAAI